LLGTALVACRSDDTTPNGRSADGTTTGPDGATSTGGGTSDGGHDVDDGGADATIAGGGTSDGSHDVEDGGADATLTGDGGLITLPDGAVVPFGDAGTDGGHDAGPVTQQDFPLDTPGLGGYTLTDAFPNAEELDIPAVITFAKTDTTNSHPFVLERTGIIRRMADDGTWDYQHPVVDFGAKVNVGGEGGAVGMVLHPSFGDGTGTHDFIYVWYNACGNGQTGPFGCTTYSQKLERYTFHAATNTADTPTLFIEEAEFMNIHNAGRMLFGSDGYLYFGNGDDGDEGDYGNHQTVSNAMFAGIFRIDVDADAASPNSHVPLAHTPNAFHQSGPYTRQNYLIPNDNPFANVAGNVEEFYALGFRNPYSWSFDTATGKLWLGDVGDSFREEVDLVTKGANYQWPIMEGDLTNLQPDVTVYVPNTTPTPPVYVYSHASIADLSSIFGGFVYHGAALPELDGKLLYTDWITNHVWSLDITQSPPVRTALIENQYKSQPLGWGQDNAGEVYFIQYDLGDANSAAIHGGHVRKIVRDTVVASAPKQLTGTFLFKDVPSLTPAADLIPYTVSSPLWSDGAVKQRWLKLPAGQKVSLINGTGTTMDGTFKYPVGTMFIKQFDMAADLTITGRSRHLETRVMVVGNDTTYGYTFRWRPDGSDADLVADQEDETPALSTCLRSRSISSISHGVASILSVAA